MAYAKEPLRNTFRHGGGEPIEFETAPKGVGIYGLVSIKNVDLKDMKGNPYPGYQLTFCHRDHPNAFLCYKQSATMSDRSNLGKALIRMTNGAFDKFEELDEGEAFKLLMDAQDRWYQIMVGHTEKEYPDPQPNDPGHMKKIIFTKVIDNDIRLVDVPGERPKEYFKHAREALRAAAAEKAGAAVAAVTTSPAVSGFEGYQDGSLKGAGTGAAPVASAPLPAASEFMGPWDGDDIPF